MCVVLIVNLGELKFIGKRFSPSNFPAGKIAGKAVCRCVFLTTWHCVLSAELTKTHSFKLFFGDKFLEALTSTFWIHRTEVTSSWTCPRQRIQMYVTWMQQVFPKATSTRLSSQVLPHGETHRKEKPLFRYKITLHFV